MKPSHPLVMILFLSVASIALPTQGADFTTYTGAQLFKRLCAACHGPEAKGDGPVAASLNVAVPNLREISKRHGGRFPAEDLAKFIDGRKAVTAHGTRQMPVWGDELLRSEAGDPEAEAAEKALIQKIVSYLNEIQDTNK